MLPIMYLFFIVKTAGEIVKFVTIRNQNLYFGRTGFDGYAFNYNKSKLHTINFEKKKNWKKNVHRKIFANSSSFQQRYSE